MFNKLGTGIKDKIEKIPIPCGSKQEEEAKEKLEKFEQFEHVHERLPEERCLGEKAGMLAAKQGESLQLYVTDKVFAHNKLVPIEKCKDTFATVLRKQNAEGKKEKVICMGKTSNVNNRVVLHNQVGDVMGILIQDIHIAKQSYQIFGTHPLYKNQRPSDRLHHETKALFCYGIIRTEGKKSRMLTLDMADVKKGGFQVDTFTMEVLRLGAGVLAEKPILVSKHGQPAAVLRQGEFPSMGITTPAWNINVAPGIDPLLVMGLVAVMDAQSV